MVNVTSIIPNLSESSADDIQNCLSGYTSFYDPVASNKTVSECLKGRNVPFSNQEMQYTLRPVNGTP